MAVEETCKGRELNLGMMREVGFLAYFSIVLKTLKASYILGCFFFFRAKRAAIWKRSKRFDHEHDEYLATNLRRINLANPRWRRKRSMTQLRWRLQQRVGLILLASSILENMNAFRLAIRPQANVKQ
jgi:hypothetical protein